MPGSVAHDGSRDVSLLLQAVLDSVPDGGCLRLRPDGRYRMNGTLRIAGRNDFTLDGNGAVLFTDQQPRVLPEVKSKRPHVQVVAGMNVTIENLAIDGPNHSGKYRDIFETDHAFDVTGATGLTIREQLGSPSVGRLRVRRRRRVAHPFGHQRPNDRSARLGEHLPRPGGTDSASQGTQWGSASRGTSSSGSTDPASTSSSTRAAASDVEIVGNTFREFRLNWIAAGEGPATDIYVGFNQIEGDSMHWKMGPRGISQLYTNAGRSRATSRIHRTRATGPSSPWLACGTSRSSGTSSPWPTGEPPSSSSTQMSVGSWRLTTHSRTSHRYSIQQNHLPADHGSRVTPRREVMSFWIPRGSRTITPRCVAWTTRLIDTACPEPTLGRPGS